MNDIKRKIKFISILTANLPLKYAANAPIPKLTKKLTPYPNPLLTLSVISATRALAMGSWQANKIAQTIQKNKSK